MCESPLAADSESRVEDVVDGLRIRFSTRLLHHLTDEPSGESRLRLHLLHLLGIGGDDRIDRSFDRGGVCQLTQSSRLTDRAWVSTFAPEDVGQVFRDFAGD